MLNIFTQRHDGLITAKKIHAQIRVLSPCNVVYFILGTFRSLNNLLLRSTILTAGAVPTNKLKHKIVIPTQINGTLSDPRTIVELEVHEHEMLTIISCSFARNSLHYHPWLYDTRDTFIPRDLITCVHNQHKLAMARVRKGTTQLFRLPNSACIFIILFGSTLPFGGTGWRGCLGRQLLLKE